MADTTRAEFNPADMPTTPRHHIKYPGANDLVRFAPQQFKAMAESINDNIDRMPAEITKRVDEAATTASAAATRAEAAAAKAGTLADQNMADNITATDTKTGAALDQWRRRGNRYHNAVIIGDSLSKGYYDGKEHDGQGIGENICSMLGVTTVQNLAVSGSGYTVGGTNTFPKQWDRAANKSDVDLVLVIGGVNDNNTDCSAAVTQLLNSIATDAPEAVTYVFPVAGGLGLGIHNRMTCLHSINTAALALTATTNGRVVLMQGVHRWGQMIPTTAADGHIHMKQAGYQIWANIAAKLIRTGQNTYWPEYSRDLKVVEPGGTSIFDQVQAAKLTEQNGTVTLTIRAHAARTVNIGYGLFENDPYFMSDAEAKFIPINTVINCFIVFQTDRPTVQMNKIPADTWVLIETSWQAGR